MKNKIRLVAMVLLAAVVSTGIAALLTSPPASAGTCWRVDCNTCCQVGSKVICTQHLCS
jgi:hypothetical protein